MKKLLLIVFVSLALLAGCGVVEGEVWTETVTDEDTGNDYMCIFYDGGYDGGIWCERDSEVNP